jgi:hypothetical protein
MLARHYVWVFDGMEVVVCREVWETRKKWCSSQASSNDLLAYIRKYIHLKGCVHIYWYMHEYSTTRLMV